MLDNYGYRHTLTILIAFPLQQWLHKGASMLCYKYIAFIVCIYCQLYSIVSLYVNMLKVVYKLYETQ